MVNSDGHKKDALMKSALVSSGRMTQGRPVGKLFEDKKICHERAGYAAPRVFRRFRTCYGIFFEGPFLKPEKRFNAVNLKYKQPRRLCQGLLRAK
jgi:hypothetical protein